MGAEGFIEELGNTYDYCVDKCTQGVASDRSIVQVGGNIHGVVLKTSSPGSVTGCDSLVDRQIMRVLTLDFNHVFRSTLQVPANEARDIHALPT